jgi:uncharacterized DUF497 family protein
MRSYYIDAMKLPDFEWDDFKNAQNTEKHGVSFYEAQYAFADHQRVIVDELVKSQKCPRIVIPVKTGIQRF